MSVISGKTRLKHHALTTAGTIFTVPATDDFTDGTWVATDLVLGEIGFNLTDDRAFFRSANGIVEMITSTFVHLWERTGDDIQAVINPLASPLIDPNILPATDDMSDIGSSVLRWKDLYLGEVIDFSVAFSVVVDTNDVIKCADGATFNTTNLKIAPTVISSQNARVTNGATNSSILGGLSNTLNATAIKCVILGGESNTIDGSNSAVIASNGITATYDQTLYSQDAYRVSPHTVQTTDATVTNLMTFTPDVDGVYIIDTNITGLESATGDALGIKQFTVFKVIAGAVTIVSASTTDKKSNFAGAVSSAIDTDGTVIRLRVVGKAATTIDWRGTLTITR